MNTKSAFKALSLLLLLFPAASFAMLPITHVEPLTQFITKKRKSITAWIKKQCTQQPKEQKEWCARSTLSAEKFYETKHKIKNLTTISEVDNEINNIKDNIYHENLTALTQISGQKYDVLKDRLDDERDIIIEVLQKKDNVLYNIFSYITGRTNDDNIPANIPAPVYSNFKILMSSKHINPNNIRLEHKDEENGNTVACAYGGVLSSYRCLALKPKITTYKSISNHNFTDDELLWILAHELGHIFSRHSTMRTIVSQCIDNNTNSNLSNPQNENTMQQLPSTIEQEANINAASFNRDLARTGKKYNCNPNRYHNRIIDPQYHCYEMKTMYALMKQREKLTHQKEKAS